MGITARKCPSIEIKRVDCNPKRSPKKPPTKLPTTPLAIFMPKFNPKIFALFSVFVTPVIAAITTVKAVTVKPPFMNESNTTLPGSTT